MELKKTDYIESAEKLDHIDWFNIPVRCTLNYSLFQFTTNISPLCGSIQTP